MKLTCSDCSMGPCTIDMVNCEDPTDLTDCPAMIYSGQDSGVTWRIVE